MTYFFDGEDGGVPAEGMPAEGGDAAAPAEGGEGAAPEAPAEGEGGM